MCSVAGACLIGKVDKSGAVGATATVSSVSILNVVALAAGAVGLVGGIVGIWVAMRTATRVAVKVVAAANDSGPKLSDVERRLRLLEEWRWQTAASAPPPQPAAPADTPPAPGA